jgi:hypothetical protein
VNGSFEPEYGKKKGDFGENGTGEFRSQKSEFRRSIKQQFSKNKQ